MYGSIQFSVFVRTKQQNTTIKGHRYDTIWIWKTKNSTTERSNKWQNNEFWWFQFTTTTIDGDSIEFSSFFFSVWEAFESRAIWKTQNNRVEWQICWTDSTNNHKSPEKEIWILFFVGFLVGFFFSSFLLLCLSSNSACQNDYNRYLLSLMLYAKRDRI